MCVVTLLPLPGGFVLTSNRDEHVSRPAAIPPKTYLIDGHSITFPKDPQGGGTWLATSGVTTVCLLNGAFVNHVHQPPYRRSRGLVVLDYFKAANLRQFINSYEFTGIEPFTMVIVHNEPEALAVHELRWNGEQLYHREMPPKQPHIWSSVTLYSLPAAELRKSWLVEFLYHHPHYTADELFRFHQVAGDGNSDHDFVMNRGIVRTVSLTQVAQSHTDHTIRYHDLVNGRDDRFSLRQP